MLQSEWKLRWWKQIICLLTATCSSVIQQNESGSAVALSSGLGLIGALVVVRGVRAQLGTASVVNWTWCQLWKQVIITVIMRELIWEFIWEKFQILLKGRTLSERSFGQLEQQRTWARKHLWPSYFRMRWTHFLKQIIYMKLLQWNTDSVDVTEELKQLEINWQTISCRKRVA